MDCSLVAYVKGGARERYNPLTGLIYERSQTHEANEAEESTVTSTSYTAPSRDQYNSKRGRGLYVKRGDERNKWKGRGRENSPYQRVHVESTSKTVDVNKAKEKS